MHLLISPEKIVVSAKLLVKLSLLTQVHLTIIFSVIIITNIIIVVVYHHNLGIKYTSLPDNHHPHHHHQDQYLDHHHNIKHRQ